ncbi:MAG: hypothetical protein AAGK66_08090, partial [Pseudomonadota bacterium]
RRWARRHSLEAAILHAMGHSFHRIGTLIGFTGHTVQKHLRKDRLLARMDLVELQSLAEELKRLKAFEALALAPSGSADMKRIGEMIEKSSSLTKSETEARDRGMISINDVNEMSDDELTAYVASMVPGLETSSMAEPDT